MINPQGFAFDWSATNSLFGAHILVSISKKIKNENDNKSQAAKFKEMTRRSFKGFGSLKPVCSSHSSGTYRKRFVSKTASRIVAVEN